jgi:uncharacterized membrane protein
MQTSRLEAFSDGVIAIIITIMILEIKAPHTASIADWQESIPKVIAYIFSFLVLAIYWNNHHHLLRASKKISTKIMWANMHLLFWLSLIPIATAWVGEHGNYTQQWPVALYASIGFMSGMAYFILSRAILLANPGSPTLQRIEKDKKGLISQVVYTVGILLAFVQPIASLVLIGSTAILWVIPDRRLSVLDQD